MKQYIAGAVITLIAACAKPLAYERPKMNHVFVVKEGTCQTTAKGREYLEEALKIELKRDSQATIEKLCSRADQEYGDKDGFTTRLEAATLWYHTGDLF